MKLSEEEYAEHMRELDLIGIPRMDEQGRKYSFSERAEIAYNAIPEERGEEDDLL